MEKLEHVAEVRNVIGEGPIWHSQEGSLYWVNFMDQYQIWRFTPSTGCLKTFETALPVMALGIRNLGGFIAATSKGIQAWDPRTGVFKPFCDPLVGRTGVRFNDAGTDRKGRFWVGTVNDRNPKGTDGELFRVMGDGTYLPMDRNITVANGIGWSPDSRIMYFTDSFRYSIYAYDYDLAAGAINNRRIFVKSVPGAGIPDGLTVDSEGFVWSALWGGWKVVRYSPDGTIDRECRLPVPNPTSCAFGGERLDRLYITSASLGLSPQQKLQHAQSGDLFCFEGGISGIDEFCFAG